MMKLIRNIFIPFCCLLLLLFYFLHIDSISNFFVKYIEKVPDIQVEPQNEYAKNENFLFVQKTDQFIPYSKQDIKNIFYSIVDNGWKEFTFYCPSEYTLCIDDIKEFSQDQDLLTHLNNFVHPYNGFSNVKTMISESGEITVYIDYFYDENTIEVINQKVEEIMKENLNNTMTTEEKIRVIHDYIINHTKYDVERNNESNSIYHSYIAYGPLIEGYATCNGYTDAMAIFLTKLGIPNFKVAMTPENETKEVGHVWNALYLNQEWLHLDLTWDDPVSTDGKDYLKHKYFLITTEELEKADSGEVVVTEHQFKRNIYLELKEKEN